MKIAADLVPADGYVIWRLRPETGWEKLAVDGVSPQFARITSAQETTELEFTEPVAVEEVLTWPVAAPRRQAYEDEGVASMFVVPLTLNGLRQGAFVFYHRMRHRYSDVDLHVAAALANLTAAAMTTAELFDEHRRVVRAGVLADVLRGLSSPMNCREMLANTVAVVVPRMSDWCAVDLVGRDGQIERGAATHVDESKGAMIRELERRFPELQFTRGAPGSVMSSGESGRHSSTTISCWHGRWPIAPPWPRERSGVRGGAARQSPQGQFSRDPLTRVAHAAERHLRLHVDASIQCVWQTIVANTRSNRGAERQDRVADAVRPARRVAHRVGEAHADDAADGSSYTRARERRVGRAEGGGQGSVPGRGVVDAFT